MKKLIIMLLFFAVFGAASAQGVPQSVNFSAVLRDSAGNVMPETSVRLRLSFLEGGPESLAVYTAETTTTTNAGGYVSLTISRNLSSYGMQFTQIPWGNADFWFRVEYKTDEMDGFRLQGNYELTSNFYAFVAGKANKLEGIDFDIEGAQHGDALVYNSETGKFETQTVQLPEIPVLSTVLRVGNDAGGSTISDLAGPVNASDIVTKEYADSVYDRIMTAISNINCSHNGHEYVDLGLPSGTMWAKCNVGAATPEGLGEYYAWGEIYTKDDYSGGTYIYSGEPGDTLPAEADVASVFWGGGWHVPTSDEMEELRSCCAWKYVQQNGRNGFTVTGPNGSSIFLPCGGYRYGTTLYSSNFGAYYRTASAELLLYCYSSRFGMTSGHVYTGYEIRPVFRFGNND